MQERFNAKDNSAKQLFLIRKDETLLVWMLPVSPSLKVSKMGFLLKCYFKAEEIILPLLMVTDLYLFSLLRIHKRHWKKSTDYEKIFKYLQNI